MKEFKIIHVTNYYFPTQGGLSTYIKNLKDNLEKKNIENEVIAFPYLFRKIEEGIGIKFLRKSLHIIFSLTFVIYTSIYLMIKKFFSEKAFIINSHDANFCAVIGISCKFFGCKTVHTFHTAPNITAETKIKNFINKIILRKIDKYIFISQYIKNKFEDVYGIIDKNSEVIITPINKGGLRNEHKNKVKKIIFIGNLVDWKDPLTLIKSLKFIRESINYNLTIIGEGYLKKEILELAEKIGVINKINLIGVVKHENIGKFLQNSDLLVLSSMDEGLALVLLEAMSYGIPVVATKCGGPEEIIQNGVNGHLVEKRDPKQLAKAIELTIKNKNKLGNNAFKIINEKYSWAKNLPKFIDFYRYLIEPEPQKRGAIFLFEGEYDSYVPSATRIKNLAEILSPYFYISMVCQNTKFPIGKFNFIFSNRDNKSFIGRVLLKLSLFSKGLKLLIIKRNKYLIVRDFKFVLMFFPFAQILNKKIIYDMHCLRYMDLTVIGKKIKSVIQKPFEKLAIFLSNSIFVISKGLLEDLPEKIRNKSILVPNGVDLKEFNNIKYNKLKILKELNISKNKTIVTFLGNYIEWLDIESVIESSKKLDNCIFLIVGNFENFEKLDYYKEKYKNVIFTGRVPHDKAISILSISDIALLPYKNVEILRHLSIRKLREYLAADKPIVMSDSDIQERKELEENKNYILYKSENTNSLVESIRYLINNKKIANEIAHNNLDIARKFSWDNILNKSKILSIFDIYEPSKIINLRDNKVSIIIKALNEEMYLAKCIESAIRALKGYKGEIILVDSKSDDNTVEIAKRYPIKIIQLKNKKDSCCGIGPQIGYLNSKYNFIYILDGDMFLNKNFLKRALPYFENPLVAGVGGNIVEKSKYNLAFQVRAKHHIVDTVSKVPQLGMGGLYRRSAIDNVGYFSNPSLYAYEEYDLATGLHAKGNCLLRIPIKMVDHFGDETTPFQTIINRWKSKYLFGSGQYLRTSIKNKHFLRTISELKIYIFTILWAFAGIASVIALFLTTIFFNAFVIVTILIFVILLLKKRSVKGLVFSFINWTTQAIGMVNGFFLKPKTARDFEPNIRMIKNG